MTADELFSYADSAIRSLLPSLDQFRIRAPNGWIELTCRDVDDFISAVTAASGANIRCEVSSTFEGKNRPDKPIHSCILRIYFANNCLDVRLLHLLYELMLIRSPGATIEEIVRIQAPARRFEEWLEKQQP